MAQLPREFARNDLLAEVLRMRPAEIERFAQEHNTDPAVLRFALAHPERIAKLMEEDRREPPQTATHSATAAVPDDEDEEAGVSSEETGPPSVALPYDTLFVDAFSRPGRGTDDGELAGPGPIPDPEGRRMRIREEIASAEAAEPRLDERFRRVPRKVWEKKEGAVRGFLQAEYRGQCQVCRAAFQRRDGEPYFEGLYLVSRTQARWLDRPGNVLCLCPTCCAKFLYGSVEADDVLDQVGGLKVNGGGEPVLQIKLCGESVPLCFTERHLLNLQELLSPRNQQIVGAASDEAPGVTRAPAMSEIAQRTGGLVQHRPPS